jgi:hypothetical protein
MTPNSEDLSLRISTRRGRMGVCGWHLTVVSKSSMYSFPLSPSSSNRAFLWTVEGSREVKSGETTGRYIDEV